MKKLFVITLLSLLVLMGCNSNKVNTQVGDLAYQYRRPSNFVVTGTPFMIDEVGTVPESFMTELGDKLVSEFIETEDYYVIVALGLNDNNQQFQTSMYVFHKDFTIFSQLFIVEDYEFYDLHDQGVILIKKDYNRNYQYVSFDGQTTFDLGEDIAFYNDEGIMVIQGRHLDTFKLVKITNNELEVLYERESNSLVFPLLDTKFLLFNTDGLTHTVETIKKDGSIIHTETVTDGVLEPTFSGYVTTSGNTLYVKNVEGETIHTESFNEDINGIQAVTMEKLNIWTTDSENRVLNSDFAIEVNDTLPFMTKYEKDDEYRLGLYHVDNEFYIAKTDIDKTEIIWQSPEAIEIANVFFTDTYIYVYNEENTTLYDHDYQFVKTLDFNQGRIINDTFGYLVYDDEADKIITYNDSFEEQASITADLYTNSFTKGYIYVAYKVHETETTFRQAIAVYDDQMNLVNNFNVEDYDYYFNTIQDDFIYMHKQGSGIMENYIEVYNNDFELVESYILLGSGYDEELGYFGLIVKDNILYKYFK